MKKSFLIVKNFSKKRKENFRILHFIFHFLNSKQTKNRSGKTEWESFSAEQKFFCQLRNLYRHCIDNDPDCESLLFQISEAIRTNQDHFPGAFGRNTSA